MQLALPALVALAACSTAPPPSPPEQRGRVPAVDALVDAVIANKLEPIAAIVAEPIAAPLPHVAPLVMLAGAKDRLVGYDAKGGVLVWDPKSARPLARFQPTTSAKQIALSPDGNWLALCGDEVVALEVASGTEIHTYNDAPIGCGWFADGRLGVAGSSGLRIFDAKTISPVDTLPIEGARQVSVGATGAEIVTASGAVWTWSGKGGEQPVLDETAHRDPTHAIVIGGEDVADAISADGRWVVTPRGLVDPTTNQPVLAIPGLAAGWSDQAAALTPDGGAVVYAFGGFLIGHSGPIVAIASRGEDLLTASADGYAIVWRNASIAARTPRSDSPLVAAGWLDDHHFATRDAQGRERRYDAKTGEPDGEATAPLTSQTSANVGAWRITGDAAGALRLHALSLDAASARACGILRRFGRGDEASCR